IVVNFLVDRRFTAFEVSGFAGGQLAALYTLGNPLLLIALTLSNFAFGVDVLYLGVVLLLVNITREFILLLVQSGTVGSGQVTVVQFAHVVLFLIQLRFLLFQMLGFARGKFAALDSVGDAVLLVFLALVDGGRRGCRGAAVAA